MSAKGCGSGLPGGIAPIWPTTRESWTPPEPVTAWRSNLAGGVIVLSIGILAIIGVLWVFGGV